MCFPLALSLESRPLPIPDNFVQAPEYSQNFNRYSYALNNPLKFTDPDGEFVALIAIAVGAIVGGVQGYIAGNAAGYTSWDMVGSIGTGMLYGAITSGLGSIAAGGAGTASLFPIQTTGAIPGAAVGLLNGAVAGGLSGGLMSIAQGGDFWEGFKFGAIVGSVSGIMTGGVNGFLDANSKGLNPWTGGSLQDKLDYLVKKYDGLFSLGHYGNDGVDDVLVGNKNNLSECGTGLKERNGYMFSEKTHRTARGYTQPIPSSGKELLDSFNGRNLVGMKSRVFIAKRVIREAFYYASPRSLGTFIHEYSHVYDNWSGFSDYIYRVNYWNNKALEYWGEFRAYSRAFQYTGSELDYNKMIYYSNLLKIYF